jgi:hypothetical protein
MAVHPRHAEQLVGVAQRQHLEVQTVEVGVKRSRVERDRHPAEIAGVAMAQRITELAETQGDSPMQLLLVIEHLSEAGVDDSGLDAPSHPRKVDVAVFEAPGRGELLDAAQQQ